MNTEKPLISIIVPIYNEEGNIEELTSRLKKTLENYRYELLFVNDGSSDSSPLILAKNANEDPRIKVINLSRNFGHQIAVSAGLDYAKGEAVVIIDADLQDPPEVIPELINKWEEGFEVVNAKRRSRKDNFFKKITAFVFYKGLNKLLTNQIPENVGDFRLLDRKAAEALKKIKEKNRYLRGLANWIGFKQIYVLFDRDKRFSGKTHYPFRKMVQLGFNAIFSFSSLPLKVANIIAMVFMLVAVIILVYTLIVDAQGHTVPGWASQMFFMASFSAIQLFVLGIISEYIGRIYTQVQDRPLYIVSETINV